MSGKEEAVPMTDDKEDVVVGANAIARKKRTEHLETVFPEIEALAKSGKLAEALNMLYVEEKTCRVAEDGLNTSKVGVKIVQLCWEANDVQAVIDNVVLIARKRGQMATVTSAVVEHSLNFVEELGKRDAALQEKLVRGLRDVTEGRIFLEVPRAKLTRILAEMLEKRGEKEEACRVMQDVQVETFAALSDGEKTDFILEQLRLCLETGDTNKAIIIGRKVSQKLIMKEEHMERRLRYCELMEQYWTIKRDWLEVAKKFDLAYNTPCILSDSSRYLPMLTSVVLHTILAPYGSEQNDLMQRLLADRHTEEIPQWRAMLALFNRPEIIRWDVDIVAPYAKALIEIEPFRSAGTLPTDMSLPEPGKPAPASKEVWVALRQRVVEHNIRVVARFYSRITTERLAKLLQLSVADAEIAVAAQVNTSSETIRSKNENIVGSTGKSSTTEETASVYARIDRPAGIVRFGKPKDAAVMLDEWDEQVVDLISLIDDTCHLINREIIAHRVNDESGASAATADSTAMML